MNLLTSAERKFVEDCGSLWNDLCQIVEDGPTRDADLRELIVHVHALQHAVMANAAARAHAGQFRLLGSTLNL